MLILQATTTDGKTELFNLNKILTLQPNGGKTKILMGAGMAWHVLTDSIIIEELSPNEIRDRLKGGILS